jgi:hypothetical protein
MDGEVLGFDSELNLGDIIGEDNRRYGFVIADWSSNGLPERGDGVRFVAKEGRATQIYLRQGQAAHLPLLTASEAIGAVYSIALGQAGGEDAFGASVRWRGFLLPILILITLGELQTLGSDDVPIDWHQLPFWIDVLVLGFVAIGFLIILAVEIGIVALLGHLMGEQGRVAHGALAYIWVEAVLVQPVISVMRFMVGPHTPTVLIIVLAVVTIAVVIAAGRVVRSGFQLGSTVAGIFVVFAGGAVGFVLDHVMA